MYFIQLLLLRGYYLELTLTCQSETTTPCVVALLWHGLVLRVQAVVLGDLEGLDRAADKAHHAAVGCPRHVAAVHRPQAAQDAWHLARGDEAKALSVP